MADEAVTPAETPDAKRDGPDYRSTLTLPKVTPPDPKGDAIFETRDAVRSILNSMAEVHVRLSELDDWRASIEKWKQRSSERAKGLASTTSENDLAHEAQLAQERAAREALAKNVDALGAAVTNLTDIATRVEALARSAVGNKWVRRVGIGVALAIIGILGRYGIHIEVPK